MTILNEIIEQNTRKVTKKTISVKEWASIEDISYAKALKLSHAKGFPIIRIGRDRRIIMSKLDEWLEKNIGIDI